MKAATDEATPTASATVGGKEEGCTQAVRKVLWPRGRNRSHNFTVTGQ